MKNINELLIGKKIKKDKPSNVQGWQDYAANLCKEFKIDGKWKQQIFKIARDKKSWLEGRVGLVKENNKLYNELKEANKLGNYLFSTFRKK